MRLVHNIYKLGKQSFGVGEAVRSLSLSQSKYVDVSIVCQDDPEEIGHTLKESVKINFLRRSIFAQMGFHPEFLRLYNRERFDIVNQHSMWSANSILSLLLKSRGSRIICSPHGALSPEALSISAHKKKIASQLYESRVLRESSGFIALSSNEAQNIRRYGIDAPIAIIPNGVDSHLLTRSANPNYLRERFNLTTGKKIMLFLSRIHKIKGLGELIETIASSRNFQNEWLLVIVGPNEGTYYDELVEKIDRYNLKETVKFCGPIYGNDKISAYDSCDIFVLPSISEGMPMVVLEAMARGKPILTTLATPIDEIDSFRAGIRTEFAYKKRLDGLESLISMSNSERFEMGNRGREIVQSKYRWDLVAEMSIDFYGWIIGELRNKPDFII